MVGSARGANIASGQQDGANGPCGPSGPSRAALVAAGAAKLGRGQMRFRRSLTHSRFHAQTAAMDPATRPARAHLTSPLRDRKGRTTRTRRPVHGARARSRPIPKPPTHSALHAPPLDARRRAAPASCSRGHARRRAERHSPRILPARKRCGRLLARRTGRVAALWRCCQFKLAGGARSVRQLVWRVPSMQLLLLLSIRRRLLVVFKVRSGTARGQGWTWPAVSNCSVLTRATHVSASTWHVCALSHTGGVLKERPLRTSQLSVGLDGHARA